ncbi:MAG: metallophosphoesterase [Silvanigrellales bacterium]|nr:metallophosphoesterase [Silvanigrellales bacterium]
MSHFAVLSDIHANLGALDACLARIDALSHAAGLSSRMPLYILGDVLDSGPDPAGTLARVNAVGSVFLLGNHEGYVFDYAKNPLNARYSDPLWKLIPWSFHHIGRDAVEAFRTRCVFGHAEHEGRVRFFHASPESNSRNPDFFLEQGHQALAPLPAAFEGRVGALCFAGHNHYAGLHWNPNHSAALHARELWVNSGSVGYPFVEREPSPKGLVQSSVDDPVATFVTAEIRPLESGLDVRVEFHQVPHDGKALLRAFESSGCLEACDPFARAILCQCYFNEDVVYPFFCKAKALGWRQTELAARLRAYLAHTGYEHRLAAAFARLTDN